MALRGTPIGLLSQATPREKARLSHWLYRQNMEAGLLIPAAATRSPRSSVLFEIPREELAARAPRVSHDMVQSCYIRPPRAEAQLLYVMRELILQQDIPLPTSSPQLRKARDEYALFQLAAGACATSADWDELLGHIRARDWIREPAGRRWGCRSLLQIEEPLLCTFAARLWVEAQAQSAGAGRQVFVAMRFASELDSAYEEGFKVGITRAGYEPARLDKQPYHSDKLDDRVLAGIRQSRLVVADFTCAEFTRSGGDAPEGLPNGNVHFEAGFALGLGLPVLYTCQKSHVDYLSFDTRQFNHILWEDAADLAGQLEQRLRGQFGRGPRPPDLEPERAEYTDSTEAQGTVLGPLTSAPEPEE